MTYGEALERVLDGAIAWWSQHTNERDLRMALQVVMDAERSQAERDREMVLSAWMAPDPGVRQ
jgi:hypothetical protein